MMTVSRMVHPVRGYESVTNSSQIMDEVLGSYSTALGELRENSKPHINMLTMLADENCQHGKQLVDLIACRISQAQLPQKLPAIYLIDSIMKNARSFDFKPLFRGPILEIYTNIFQQLDEVNSQELESSKTPEEQKSRAKNLADLRNKLVSLRKSWELPVPLFDSSFMNQLDTVISRKLPVPSKTVSAVVPSVSGVKVKMELVELLPGKRNSEQQLPSVTTTVVKTEPLNGAVAGNMGPTTVNNKNRTEPALGIKGLPRIPKKAGFVRVPAVDHVRGSVVPEMSRGGRGRGRGSSTFVRGVGRVDGAVRMMKRPLEEDLRPENMNDPGKRKILRKPENGPEVRETREPLLPSPVMPNDSMPPLGTVGPMRGHSRFPTSDYRFPMRPIHPHHVGEPPARHPYAHPERFSYDEPVWRGGHPVTQVGAGLPRFHPGDDDFYPMGFPPVHRRPLMPTPVVPRLISIEQAIYDIKVQEAADDVQHGRINSHMYQETLVQLKKELDLQKLRAAIARKRPEADGNIVLIDEREREVLWVDSKPVVIMDGSVFDIGFAGQPVNVYVDHTTTSLHMDETRKIFFGSKYHTIKFGGPNFELVIDDIPYRVNFLGPEVVLPPKEFEGQHHRVHLGGPLPIVSVGSRKLNEELLDCLETGGKERTNSDQDMLQRVLNSSAFAELCASNQTLAAAAAPLQQPQQIAPATVMETQDGSVEDRITQIRLDGSPKNFSDALAYFRAHGTVPHQNGGELVREAVDFSAAKNALLTPNLSVRHLEKLRMIVFGEPVTSCHLCERRFLSGEREAQKADIIFHNGYVKRDEVHTSDWNMVESEFTESCTEPDEEVFLDFVRKNRPELLIEYSPKTEEKDVEEASGGLKLEENPVAPGKQNICFLCTEDIPTTLDEDADEWILRDGIKTTDPSDGTVKIFHRDCYEETKNKPVTDAPVILVKPSHSRWNTTEIAEPKLETAAMDTQPAIRPTVIATHKLVRPVMQSVRRSSVVEIEKPKPAAVESKAAGEFVIELGDEDDDDNMLVQSDLEQF